MFGIVLTITYTLLLAYFLWRATSKPMLGRRISRRGFVGIGGVLWAVFLLAWITRHYGTGYAAVAVESVGRDDPDRIGVTHRYSTFHC